MRKLKLEELGRMTVEEYRKSKKVPLTIVLDNIRSAMNVGSVFRTCDAFGVEEIILCGITAQPPHKEILKTAIGAEESVKWSYSKDITDVIKKLKNKGFHIIGVEQTDCSIDIFDYQLDKAKRVALIFGNEVFGLKEELLDLVDEAIEITQYGTKHSLNISVCAGIVIWHFNQLFRKKS